MCFRSCFLLFLLFLNSSQLRAESIKVNEHKLNDADLMAAFEERKPWLVNRKMVSSQTSTPKYLNNLINSESPYLLSHSLQPVDWLEWQADFDTDFHSGGRLVFISIGYSTCYWCHVMAQESFANTDVAEVLNQSYISIKVDREQWPLVDERFKSALELLKGEAGWPLNVILTPDGKIVWIDSYLKKDKFIKLLQGLAKRWHQQPQAISSLANRIDAIVNPDPLLKPNTNSKSNSIATANSGTNPLSKNDWRKLLPEQHRSVYQALIYEERPGEPRFFRDIWQLGLLDEYLRTGNKAYLEAVENQLAEILLSPVFDAIDGGFHRYTLDSEWQTPHFEKMLYTQANMISLLARAYGITGKQYYRFAMEQTIDWVEQWLKNDSGYSSAVSAISAGVEGKYYDFRAYQSGSGIVNLAGFNVVTGAINDTQNGSEQNHLVSIASLEFDWRELPSYQELKKYRKRKVKPEIDEKVIVSWNSRYAIALLDAFEVTGKAEYLGSSTRLLESLWQDANFDGKLYRIIFLGRASIPAPLEDYALFAQAQFRLAFYQPWQAEYHDVKNSKSTSSGMEARFSPDNSAAIRGHWLLEQMISHVDSDGKSLYSNVSNLNKDGEQSSVYTLVYEALALGTLYSPSPVYKQIASKLITSHSHLSGELFKSYSFVSSVADSLVPARLNHAIFAKGHGRIKAFNDGGIIRLEFDMEPGWHINANSVASKRFIPTQVSLVGIDGGFQSDKSIKVHYPQATEKQLSFYKTLLHLYEERFEIQVESPQLKISTDENNRHLLSIRLQACSDNLCLLPESFNLLSH
ncbi:conserved protein of unknown function [Shewanella benthica]|uniref:DUF255 domain-containing protein n=2 Tax=Shewanella benthica TaxID=43661 RepID=A0A330M7U4_9GAMM|nr:conserved protein of unknown function [Shewanella benthica]